jgi:tetratricopeptide (TPR) repeat protein
MNRCGRILFLFIALVLSSKAYTQKYASKADSLRTLIKTDGNDTNKVNHLVDLARELMMINLDSSITFAENALQISSTILADPATQKNQKLKLAAQKGVAKSYGSLGAFYYLKGEFAISLENHFKAVEIREAIGDKEMLANSYNNIGVVFRNQGDHPRALEYYTKAYNLNAEIGDKKRAAQNVNNIGLVYADQREFDLALEYFNKALALNENTGMKITSADILNNIGLVYFGKRNYLKSIDFYKKSFDINLEIGNYNEVANNLVNIGASYDLLKDHENAIKNYLEALDLNQQLGNKYGIALNMGNVASVYVEEKKYNEAKDYLTKALAIAEEISAWQLIQDANLTLSRLDSITGDYKSAYIHFQQFSAAKDTLFNASKSKDIGRLEMKQEIETVEKERKRAEEEKARIAQRERDRKNTLQYSGMFVAILCIVIVVMMLGFVKVSPAMARSITFFTFLIIFEFVLLFIDPYVDRFSGGEPVYKLILNALLACLIFPLNAVLENGLKKRLTKKGGETVIP